MTGVPVKQLNFLNIRNRVDDLGVALKKAKSFFDLYNLPFIIVIPQDICSVEYVNAFKVINYFEADESVLMVMSLTDYIDSAVGNIRLSSINEWMIPLTDAYKSTLKITKHYADRHKKAEFKKCNLYHYSLYKNEQPVSSLTLSIHNKIARIDDVGTDPSFQAKGYATSLVKYALSKAKEMGAINCYLEASRDGLKVYKNIGFKSLFTNHIYELDTSL